MYGEILKEYSLEWLHKFKKEQFWGFYTACMWMYEKISK